VFARFVIGEPYHQTTRKPNLQSLAKASKLNLCSAVRGRPPFGPFARAASRFCGSCGGHPADQDGLPRVCSENPSDRITRGRRRKAHEIRAELISRAGRTRTPPC